MNTARRTAKHFGYGHPSEKWFNRSEQADNRLTTLLYRAPPQNGILTNAKKPIGIRDIVGKRYIILSRRLIRTQPRRRDRGISTYSDVPKRS